MPRYLVVASETKFSAADLSKSDMSYRDLLDTELFAAENYVREFDDYEEALQKAKTKFASNQFYNISDESFANGYARVAVLEIENKKLVSVVALGSDEKEKRYNKATLLYKQIQNYIQKPRALDNRLDLYEINNLSNLLNNFSSGYRQQQRDVIKPSPTYSKLNEMLNKDNELLIPHKAKGANLYDKILGVDVPNKSDEDKYRDREKMRGRKKEERAPSRHKEKPRKSIEEEALEKARVKDIDVGLRTVAMQEKYEDLPDIVKSSENDSYVVLTSQVNMVELVKRGAKAVTVGKGKREIVMIDPNSEELEEFYDDLAKKIDLENVDYSGDYKNLFSKMNNQIRQNFGDKKQKSHAERKADIKKMREDWDGPTIELNGKDRAVIPTEKILENQSGVCRHHAMYTTYALAKMINDGDLDDGEVFLCRDKISSGGAHQWVVYRNKTTDDVWLIDSYWNVTLNLSDPRDYKIATEMKYGEAAIERLMDRFEAPVSQRLNL